ncbi:MAG: hypothetical protein LBT44_00770 [Clostridiales bacterium]|jgi:hypothetical protein|nr:hypothetical protein [Clostridiales bacterium]
MIETEKPSIGDGSAAIIVYDKSLENNPDAEFYQWLKLEGFKMWEYSKGFYNGVCWVYVNINSKLIARGIPGIPVTKNFGSYAVTIDEFKIIYAIFQKYTSKSVICSLEAPLIYPISCASSLFLQVYYTTFCAVFQDFSTEFSDSLQGNSTYFQGIMYPIMGGISRASLYQL